MIPDVEEQAVDGSEKAVRSDRAVWTIWSGPVDFERLGTGNDQAWSCDSCKQLTKTCGWI